MYGKRFDRNLLPKPWDYYQGHFPTARMKARNGWINVNCCFHADRQPSLSINLSSGGFYCFACGAKGRDIVGFHMQLHGVPFKTAVTHFGAWKYE